MKKILFAATLVGAAGAGIYMYMRKRNPGVDPGDKLMHDAQDLMDKTSRMFKKNWRKLNHKMHNINDHVQDRMEERMKEGRDGNNIYSHSMG
ncbi:hypothetical protein [Chitinophaga sp. Cy-1792]|uniref:hypothetical protein n=1 Tax=Chitinophaga sp. Cy-1792 TaxID=2608339 RepID=UPI00141EB2F2|nr:hypothetical protein [Chitinophaga sp. Cy-1792]NIG57108.1 hypothetical protein [Chitinophaga sp. Cy-1792]